MELGLVGSHSRFARLGSSLRKINQRSLLRHPLRPEPRRENRKPQCAKSRNGDFLVESLMKDIALLAATHRRNPDDLGER
jgi:hypothetical protein